MSKWLKAAIAAVLLLPVVSWYADLAIDPLQAARDGVGNYTVPNSYTPGDTITASSFNENFSDMGSEITNSLPRDGQAGMTGQFKASNGTVSLPGISFASDTNTGFYRLGADQIGVSIGGTQVGTFTAAGFAGQGAAFTSQVSCGFRSTAPTGWLLSSGLTIGNASSGATARANADTEDLFTELWGSSSNTELPIQDSSGVASTRGASAAADYAANKRMPLPDLSDRVVAGKGDMSGSASTEIADTDSETLGATIGEDLHTQTEAELAAHDHGATGLTASGTALSSGNHNHSVSASRRTTPSALGSSDATRIALSNTDGPTGTFSDFSVGTDGAHTHSLSISVGGTTDDTGSSTPFNVVQPTIFLNCFIKL